MPEVKKSLDLSKEEVWTSNICSVAGCIVMRVINGSFCDKYGARILMGVLLMLASIPCALTGLVQNSGESIVICCLHMANTHDTQIQLLISLYLSPVQLCILRFFIGLAGSTFVCCQYWTSRMVSVKENAHVHNIMCAEYYISSLFVSICDA